MRDDLVTVFILPPTIDGARESGCRRRAQDSAEVVQARMAKSAEEMSHWPEYDYVIVNDDLDEQRRQVAGDPRPPSARAARASVGLADFVNALRGRRRCYYAASAERPRQRAESSTDSSSARAVGAMPAAASSASRRHAERLEAGAQHLAALAEGGGGDALEHRLDRHARERRRRAASGARRSR